MKKIILGLLVVFSLGSCINDQEQKKYDAWKKLDDSRLHTVTLTKGGSEYYRCDSVFFFDGRTIELKNREDSVPFIKMILPIDVIVRITNN